MRYEYPLELDRLFLAEALCAAGEHFGRLAQQSGDAQIHEEYDTKRTQCLRLVVDLGVDLDADT